MNATWWNWRMAGGIAAVGLLVVASPVRAGNEAEVAEHLIDLVKIGRGVMSEQMGNINDAAKANRAWRLHGRSGHRAIQEEDQNRFENSQCRSSSTAVSGLGRGRKGSRG